MGIENRSVCRRRRRRDILLDGCDLVAGFITCICSSICECACLCDSCCQRVTPISEASHPAKIPLDDFGSIKDLIGTTMMVIRDGLDHTSLASEVLPPDNLPNNDDQMPHSEVKDPSPTASTTEDVHEGPNQSSPASQIPSMENRLPNFKEIDSASCEDLNSSLRSKRNDLTGPSMMNIHKQLSHPSFFSQMPAFHNEANIDDQLLSFKNFQFVGSMGDAMSVLDLNDTDSEFCNRTGTPTVDIHEPLDLSQMELGDNEANGNE